MALGDPYATVAQLEARLDTTDSGTFSDLLDAASRTVESFTGRQFNRVDAASARRFRALDPLRVRVDDFHTTDGLLVDVRGTAWDPTTDIDPRPWDGVVNGVSGWPYFDLFAINRTFPWSRRPLVTVTAQWGWAAVPVAIVQATLDVAEVMSLSMTNAQSGTIRGESIGGYSINYALPQNLVGHEDVPAELVKAVPYRRTRFGVA
jgi:hypothetical protein